MAKTQSDYEAEGAQLFNDGKECPQGNSWQAKARNKGYNDTKIRFTTIDDYNHIDFPPEIIQSEHDFMNGGKSEVVRSKIGFAEGGYVGLTEGKDFEFAGLITPGEQFIPVHPNTWMHGRKTVEHHIAELRYQSTICDNKKEVRLKQKIRKLERKWNLEINRSTHG